MLFKGFSYGYDARRGMFADAGARESVARMAKLGCDWSAVCVKVAQDTYASTYFGFDYRHTLTDREIEGMVKIHKEHGLKVCLKPMVNCADGVWRARIDFPDPEYGKTDYWSEWFSCYKAFILHYAELAEFTGCEMLCVGCELLGTERKTEHWRGLIKSVREVYGGLLVYNANHGDERGVEWFTDTDYIGTSAYYPVTKIPGDSAENMLRGWLDVKGGLKELSDEHGGKKIIFMEIGCRSARGCATMPWDFTRRDLPYDEDEQANFYSSCFEAFAGEEWFGGFFWWDWYTLLPSVAGEKGFSIYGKKAEEVVRKWYSEVS
jgi:hypothetical protein